MKNEVEYITRDQQVLEEIEYGDCYKLEVIYPKWKGLNIWYVTPYPVEGFNITEPTFILNDGKSYWLASKGEQTKELKKFFEFYFHK